MVEKATSALRNIAALCLGAGYPTLVSLPHSIINAYKNVLAIAVETDYSFPLADKVGTLYIDAGYLTKLPDASISFCYS